MTTTASPTHTDADAPADTEPLKAEVHTYDLSDAPTTHAGLLAWVAEVAALTQPDRIHWWTARTRSTRSSPTS